MKIFDSALDKLNNWLDLLVANIPNIIAAIVVFILSFFISKWISKWSKKALNRFSQNEAVNKLLAKMIAVLIVVAGIFAALGILHLDKTVTSLLAGAGVAGLAVGLAFQDPILNIISGIIMSFRKPFNIGDTVESNNFNGIIKGISLRSMVIETFTGEDVVIPNKLVIQNPLVNYTLNPLRRIDLECGVAYDSDLEKVEEVALKAIKKIDGLYESKKPQVFWGEFANSSINFTLMFWIEEPVQPSYLLAKSQAIKYIKKAFDENHIEIPFPIRTVKLEQQ
ncbi:mechanosensitive ion channel family protein [Parvicella tangerina]|uniref:Small-conductance mechanosensitive channel n=1 Tax=Parvicella tangerina TaxID=2829795 RepID=A0A916JLX2_9FLAO|nr:mechanosensitive ion channel [Parvicella tangerina]CAG5081780.1 Small-conductance mechanosensitive channel [Parvicella tangerina]